MKYLVILTIAILAACSQAPQTTAPPADSSATAPLAESATPPAPAPPVVPPPEPVGTSQTAQPVSPAPADVPAPRSTAAPAPAAAPVPAAAAPVAAAAAPAPRPQAPPKPVAPPAPTFREVTVPAGTALSVNVLSNLASNTSQIEDPVRGALADPVVIDGTTALPKGSELRGSVTDAKSSGRVKGKASLGFRFDRMVVRGESQGIQTARVLQEADDSKKDDVKKGGLGAGIGAVVGGIAGGGKGAAIGAVTGGAGTVLVTKGGEVELGAGTIVTVMLQEPMTVRVPVK